MISFSAFVFSLRMRMVRLKKHKAAVSLGFLCFIILLVLGPAIYQESWLDPFSTLNLPNRELHPQAITMLGMTNSNDPFHSYYYTNKGKIQELIHDLQLASPISLEKEQASLKNQKVEYFTLHRASSHYHAEEDFALQYYPEKSIVIFSQQAFQIDDSTVSVLKEITEGMTSGWW